MFAFLFQGNLELSHNFDGGVWSVETYHIASEILYINPTHTIFTHLIPHHIHFLIAKAMLVLYDIRNMDNKYE